MGATRSSCLRCRNHNWHPHLHLLVTDGGFRADGTFVPLPLHDVTTLTEAFRRAVLRLFVRRELMDVETAHGMLAWPHSGFHVHDGVWVAAEDRAFRRPAGPLLLESAELESQGWEVGHRLKGRVIPWKALYDNNLRQLSRKTVTAPCFGLSPSLKNTRHILDPM